MSYCRFCGKELQDGDIFCSKCGASVESQQYNHSNDFTTIFDRVDNIKDSGHLGWGLLGFLFPVIGLILFLVWKDEKPKTALMAGKGALIDVILGILITVIFIILFIVFSFASM
jgi:uncharacterized membrane protein YvbJ